MRVRRSFINPLLAAMMAVLSSPTVSAQSKATKPAAAKPTANAPSLDETLKWLVDFLPLATGAKANDGQGDVYTVTTQVQNVNGCQVHLIQTGSSTTGRWTQDETFMLSDIDPSLITIRDHEAGVESLVISILLSTRNGSKSIKSVNSLANGREDRISTAQLGYFIDKANADRAINAFRHAAELCANTQPF
jgi:hypothetical protein